MGLMPRGALVTALWALAGCSLPPLARFESIPFHGAHAPRGAPVSVRFDRTFETGDEVAMSVVFTRTSRSGREFSGETVRQFQQWLRVSCRVVVLSLDAEGAPRRVEVVIDRALNDDDSQSNGAVKPGARVELAPEIAAGMRATLTLNERRVSVERVNNAAPSAEIGEQLVLLFSGSTLSALSERLFGDVSGRHVGENWVVGTHAVTDNSGVRRLVSYHARLDWHGTHAGADSVRLRGWAISPELSEVDARGMPTRHRTMMDRAMTTSVDGSRVPFGVSERWITDVVRFVDSGNGTGSVVPRAESLIETIEVSYDRFTPAPRSRPAPNRVEGGEGEGVATK